MEGRVSLVIPNYNGQALMARHLPSVLEALEAYPPGGELLVVDDGSVDESVPWLKREAPKARILVHGENRGFQAACTTGIRQARFEAVVLLNTDVEVRPDFIAPLVETLGGEKVFAAACLALRRDGSTLGENLKIPRLRLGKLTFDKMKNLDLAACRARMPGPLPTLFATGGFMALKRSLFFSLGGFDPLFQPFYYEDADLCYRAWKRGYRVLLQPASVVIHEEAGTIRGHFAARRTRRIKERNRFFLLWKNLTDPGPFLLAHLVPLFFRVLTKWLVLDLDFYASLFGALKRIGTVRKARRGEREAALRSDRELFLLIREGAPTDLNR